MKKVIVTIAAIIVIIVFGIVMFACNLFGHAANSVVKSGVEIFDKTVDANNVIYNYEWFKTQYNSYDQMLLTYKNAQKDLEDFEKSAGDRKDWNYSTTNEDSRLRSIISGYRNQVQDIIKEYNAKSQMVNRSIFKTGDLPEQLPLNF